MDFQTALQQMQGGSAVQRTQWFEQIETAGIDVDVPKLTLRKVNRNADPAPDGQIETTGLDDPAEDAVLVFVADYPTTGDRKLVLLTAEDVLARDWEFPR